MSPKNAHERARLFKALGAPERVSILDLLLGRPKMRPSDIAEKLHGAQPNISYHLNQLGRAGLLTHEDIGRERFYEVNHDREDEIRNLL